MILKRYMGYSFCIDFSMQAVGFSCGLYSAYLNISVPMLFPFQQESVQNAGEKDSL
jgi:hypothetical protein